MNINSYIDHHLPAGSSIQPVSLLKPLQWLRLGMKDFIRHPGASLAHGLLVSCMALIILFFSSTHPFLIAAAISAFMLMGPIMAAGLCELSKRHETGDIVNFDASLSGIQDKMESLTHFAGVLFSFSVLWFLISGLLLYLTVGEIAPAFNETLWTGFVNSVSKAQLALYVLVGSILACIIFVISVVTVPAILDQEITIQDAMVLSFKVTLSNLPTMIFWSALLVILSAIGFASFLLAMIVIYPLLGHATWYAYRDMVKKTG